MTKIKLITAVFLILALVVSIAYSCTPTSGLQGTSEQGCPGLYKRQTWQVCFPGGSQGAQCSPITTSGNGACGAETACNGSFTGWKSCWPEFYTPVHNWGCWSQLVKHKISNCFSNTCADGSTYQTCDCQDNGSFTYQVSGPGACNGC